MPTVLKAHAECQVKSEEESEGGAREGQQEDKGGVMTGLLAQPGGSLYQNWNKSHQLLGREDAQFDTKVKK